MDMIYSRFGSLKVSRRVLDRPHGPVGSPTAGGTPGVYQSRSAPVNLMSTILTAWWLTPPLTRAALLNAAAPPRCCPDL